MKMDSLAQVLAEIMVRVKEYETRLVFGVVVSVSPLKVKYEEIVLDENFLFVEDRVDLTVGQEVPLLKTNRSQKFIVMMSPIPLPMTAEDILALLSTVDGHGSELDADLLDGRHGNEYVTVEDLVEMWPSKLDTTAYTATDVLTKLKTVDGVDSGLDADMLQGKGLSDSAVGGTLALRTPAGNILAKSFHEDGEHLYQKYARLGSSNTYTSANTFNGQVTFAGGITPIRIPQNANLNDYTTPGFYYSPATADASTMTNIPSKVAFGLNVYLNAGVTQVFFEYFADSSFKMFIRNQYSTTWGAWREWSIDSMKWGSITEKPSTFTPSSHTHAWSEVTSIPATATRWPTWAEVTSKPSTFAPSTHSHTATTLPNMYDLLYSGSLTTGTQASLISGMNFSNYNMIMIVVSFASGSVVTAMVHNGSWGSSTAVTVLDLTSAVVYCNALKASNTVIRNNGASGGGKIIAVYGVRVV